MKRLLAFILLLSHVNTSMFLPQVPEDDVYDKNGNQVDDINSIVEFVMVKLGVDHHSDDEDNDQGQNFHMVKIFDYSYQPYSSKLKTDFLLLQQKDGFGEHEVGKIPRVAYDIIIPPPTRLV